MAFLVEHQRVLVTVESPRGACQAVPRKPRSETTRVLSMATHNIRKHHVHFGDCTDPGPRARTLGCLRRFSFLRALFLRVAFAYSSASPGAACPKCPCPGRAKKKTESWLGQRPRQGGQAPGAGGSRRAWRGRLAGTSCIDKPRLASSRWYNAVPGVRTVRAGPAPSSF